MRTIRLRAPIRNGGADNHQPAINDRRHRPAAVCGEGGELFADRAIPQQLPVTIQRDEIGADTQRIDVSRLGIGSRRRPSHPVGRHVALEHVELVFPNQLPRCGIERHDALLQRRAAARWVLHVNAIAHHDGRGTAAVRRAPEEVLAVERPLFRKAGFQRASVPIGASRFRPVTERDTTAGLRRRRCVLRGAKTVRNARHDQQQEREPYGQSSWRNESHRTLPDQYLRDVPDRHLLGQKEWFILA